MADLEAHGAVPSDLDEGERRSPLGAIVKELREHRTLSPTGTDGQLQRIGRGDVDPLHSPASGGRDARPPRETRGVVHSPWRPASAHRGAL